MLKQLITAAFLFTSAAAIANRPSKTSNVSRQKNEFSWSADHRLTWDDFRGPVQNDRDYVAAETSCGIGFETNVITRRGEPVVFTVYNTFSTTRSWVRPEARTDEVLEHEQGHFDLCELYTRKLRQRFDGIGGLTVDNLKRVSRSIWNEVHGEYRERQEQYEQETEHGLNRAAQEAWTVWLEKELNTTEQLASN